MYTYIYIYITTLILTFITINMIIIYIYQWSVEFTRHVLVTVRLAWNLGWGGTKKVPGTRYSTQWKTPKSEPYRTVPCRTMQWKSAIRPLSAPYRKCTIRRATKKVRLAWPCFSKCGWLDRSLDTPAQVNQKIVSKVIGAFNAAVYSNFEFINALWPLTETLKSHLHFL